MTMYRVHYRHDDCEVEPGVTWEDTYSCAVNGECPACGVDEIEAVSWEEIEDEDGRMSLNGFIALHAITMKAENIESRAHGAWSLADLRGRLTWECRLNHKHSRRTLKVIYTMGVGDSTTPTLPQVLDCVASDVSSFDNATGALREWASELGFSMEREDLPTTRRVFHAVRKEANDLRKWLPSEAYENLLWHTERE